MMYTCHWCRQPFDSGKLQGQGAVLREGKPFHSQACYHAYFMDKVTKEFKRKEKYEVRDMPPTDL